MFNRLTATKVKGFFLFFGVLFSMTMSGCKEENETRLSVLLTSLQLGNESLLDGSIENVSLNQSIIASFNLPIDTTSFSNAISVGAEGGNPIPLRYNFFNENKTISIYPLEPYETYREYTIRISDALTGTDGESFEGSENTFTTLFGELSLTSITSGDVDMTSTKDVKNVSLTLPIIATFSGRLNMETVNSQNVTLRSKGRPVATDISVEGNQLSIQPTEKLNYWTTYELDLATNIAGIGDIDFKGFETSFFTELDSTLKFPEISDEELLTKVQEQTFKYFWDFGHPTSGLTRERNTSGETVTSGGSGFGIMCLIVGIERGFITREEGVERLLTIVNFLQTKAERFHGVWSHWLNGTTGIARPFSAKDDGGDLVETSFVIQGLITVRQYLNNQDPTEAEIISKINILVDEVEWGWYRQNEQNTLYWHWSENFGWDMNHRISGWNEALIVYVLAASSSTHTIDKPVYESGWARNGSMRNTANNTYYGYKMPLRTDRGGPLFFAHYSFLGLDPRNLSDQYANYWEQNVNHTLINRAYCVANPRRYIGYSAQSWGLTASDSNPGYSAHSPDNDRGVITPTAAISSIPYTPDESMEAIKFFYYILGDRLWGEYGFYDAFSATEEWTASSYLAIDQGPIILMIENHRTGLLWNLFMSAPEVSEGLTKLGFDYE